MKEHNAFLRSVLPHVERSVSSSSTELDKTHPEILFQTSKVQSNGLLVEVAVSANLQARITEDGNVVSPRRNREVNDLSMGVETTEESTTNAKGTGSRDRLCYRDLYAAIMSGCILQQEYTNRIVHERLALCAVCKLCSIFGELWKTGDRQVFLVGISNSKKLLCLCILRC
jgi:hypothetical protein